MILGHFGGLPVEEAFLGFATLGIGALYYSARCRVAGWWRSRAVSRAGGEG
jgi:hypothetical protein